MLFRSVSQSRYSCFPVTIPPSNSDLQTTCATATNITAPGTFTSGVLSGTGASQPGASAARWYKFTPSTNGMLQISSCSGGADTRLWIWSGTCGNLQAVANNDDFAGCISTGASEYASRIQNLILLAGAPLIVTGKQIGRASCRERV